MSTPKDITNALVDWKKRNPQGFTPLPNANQTGGSATLSDERALAFDYFSWLVYSMLFTFLVAQVLVLAVFDLF